jgi:serine protease inhibitor
MVISRPTKPGSRRDPERIAQPTGSALVSLSLPRVTFTSASFSLADALKTMGMPLAFDPSRADFSAMAHLPPDAILYIKDVLQKATISMLESGVEAAAATAVIVDVDASTGPPQPIVPMVVNRPFFMALVDVPTGAVLMMGHVTDPTDAGGP